jgi:hypothetical protein
MSAKECKEMFKNAIQISTQNMNLNAKSIVNNALIKIAFNEDDVINNLFEGAKKHAMTVYKRQCKNFNKELCYKHNIHHIKGYNTDNNSLYTNFYKWLTFIKRNTYQFNKIEYEYRKEANKLIPLILDIAGKYKEDISYIINKLKSNDPEIYDVDYDFSSLNDLWINIVALELSKIQSSQFVNYLDGLKYDIVNTVKPITKKEIAEVLNKL